MYTAMYDIAMCHNVLMNGFRDGFGMYHKMAMPPAVTATGAATTGEPGLELLKMSPSDGRGTLTSGGYLK